MSLNATLRDSPGPRAGVNEACITSSHFAVSPQESERLSPYRREPFMPWDDQALRSAVIARVTLGSTGMLGPMDVVKVTFFR